jgi:hypothetical protein
VIKQAGSISAATSSASASRTRRRASGVAAGFATADGVVSPAEHVVAAAHGAAVAQGRAPFFSSAALRRERAAVEQFLADLAAAPDIVGELVALYVEQYPRLALWFVARALKVREDAALRIAAAARWREVCGAEALAEMIFVALDYALPPEPEPARGPPLILDIDEGLLEF